jgi:hypothetical protein
MTSKRILISSVVLSLVLASIVFIGPGAESQVLPPIPDWRLCLLFPGLCDSSNNCIFHYCPCGQDCSTGMETLVLECGQQRELLTKHGENCFYETYACGGCSP